MFNGGDSAFTMSVGTLVSTSNAASGPTPNLMSCGKRGGVDQDGSIDVALRGAAARPLATARLVSVASGFFLLADACEVNHFDTSVSPCTELPACELRGWMPNRRIRHAVSDAVLAFEQQDEIINWISCTVMVGLLASALLLQRLVCTTACNHPSMVRRAPSHFLPPVGRFPVAATRPWRSLSRSHVRNPSSQVSAPLFFPAFLHLSSVRPA